MPDFTAKPKLQVTVFRFSENVEHCVSLEYLIVTAHFFSFFFFLEARREEQQQYILICEFRYNVVKECLRLV